MCSLRNHYLYPPLCFKYICILSTLLTPFQGTTNVYGQHKDSPIVVGNLKSGYRYTVMVCRVNGNAQGPDWSVKDVCALEFCHIGSGATMVIITPLNIVAWTKCTDAQIANVIGLSSSTHRPNAKIWNKSLQGSLIRLQTSSISIQPCLIGRPHILSIRGHCCPGH